MNTCQKKVSHFYPIDLEIVRVKMGHIPYLLQQWIVVVGLKRDT